MNKKELRPLYRFLKLIFPYRKKWFLVLILSNATAIISLFNPYLAKLAIDEVVGRKDLSSLILISLTGAGIFLFNSLVNAIKESQEEYINKKVHFDLNKELFEHMHRLSLGWFRNQSTSDHIYIIENDGAAVTAFVTSTLPQALCVIPKLLLTLAIVFYLNWRMALASFILAPFIYIPSNFFSKKIEKIREEIIIKSQDVFKILEEGFSHIHLIKAFGNEATTIKKYLDSLIVNMGIDIKSNRWGRVGGFVSELSTKIIIGLIGLYGGYQVIKGNMSVGSLTAIIAYLLNLIYLQVHLASFLQGITMNSFSCRRLSEILDEKPQIVEARDAKNVLFKKGEIIFDSVSFWYHPEKRIIENLNFQISGASHIAIAAPSGRGKTTILNLLVRLYDPLKGQIIIDGCNIRDLSFSSLKGQIGFALQESFLWNESIENNIRYGREDADMKDIVGTAKMAGVDEFTDGLTNGLRTIIGENACKLSEGQKQKISIARALIRNPKILIFDEAMSSMDSASEEKIITNIKENRKGVTIITISHRLSTVMSADLVYYFYRPNEMIVDSAKNLFETNKEFADLFSGQDKILA